MTTVRTHEIEQDEQRFLLVGMLLTSLAAAALLVWGIVSAQVFVDLLAVSLLVVGGGGWAFERFGTQPR